MKKLFYSLSLALVGALAVNAAVPAAVNQLQAKPNIKTVKPSGASSFKSLNPDKKVKLDVNGKAAPTKEDFIGEYSWKGGNCLVEEQLPSEGIMTISQDPVYPDSLRIKGFQMYDTNEGYLSAYVEEGVLYIPNQFLFRNPTYNQDFWFWNYSFKNYVSGDVKDYIYQKNDKYKYRLNMDANGNLYAGDILQDDPTFDANGYTDEQLLELSCVAADIMPDPKWVDYGFIWLIAFVEAKPLEFFEFVSDEWVPIGNAKFKDAWFPIFWPNADTPEYDVPLFCNRANHDRYMLLNPYGPNTPYGTFYEELGGTINLSNKQGYLVFDVSEPECVLFEPMVYSITIDMNEDPTMGEWPVPLYCYNWEGYQYFINYYTTSEIIRSSYTENKELSFLDPDDPEGWFVGINNGQFSMYADGIDFLTPQWWMSFDQAGNQIDAEMSGWIYFPKDYNSVESIGEESNEAPVYYNLQGVQVANPEKGQLLIVRKGNKSSKKFIR